MKIAAVPCYNLSKSQINAAKNNSFKALGRDFDWEKFNEKNKNNYPDDCYIHTVGRLPKFDSQERFLSKILGPLIENRLKFANDGMGEFTLGGSQKLPQYGGFDWKATSCDYFLYFSRPEEGILKIDVSKEYEQICQAYRYEGNQRDLALASFLLANDWVKAGRQ